MEEKLCLLLKKIKKPISFDKLCEKLEIYNIGERNLLLNTLNYLVNNYKVYKTSNDNYVLMNKTSFRVGEFYGNRNNGGKVLVTTDYYDNLGEHHIVNTEYIIDSDCSMNAVDGDKVIIEMKHKQGDDRNTAIVSKILDRNINYIFGEVYKMGNSFFVKSIDKKQQNIIVLLEGDNHIEGSLVSVKLNEFMGNNYYKGSIIEKLGHKDDPNIDSDKMILLSAAKHGITPYFSDDSIKQIKETPNKVLDSDRIGRNDLTSWTIFTIDGKDTKDIDDALSCQKLENGNFLVGVHIADVSNYVPFNSPLDIDSRKKGTSAYLGGKVIPMLPHELSNGICSLNPNVERLALSCIMEINKDGNVVKHSICKSIIKSRIKMNYDKVNDLLIDGIVDKEYEEYYDSLVNLNNIAKILRKKRFSVGAIEFNKPELRVVLNEDGNLEDIVSREQKDGEKLIEEFMLLANETVDKRLSNNGFPVVHRVHDIPNEERMEKFLELLNMIGIGFIKYDAAECCENPFIMQKLVKHISNIPSLSSILTTDLIRCMSRAKYSAINIGHNGLAKKNYCHFTSPIRRYPDLTVHRIIKDCILDLDNYEKNKYRWENAIPEIAYHSSIMERAADSAEMDVLSLKCAEYMKNFIGQKMNGIIIGVGDNGVQVELDNKIEARILPSNYPKNLYYNSDNFSLRNFNNSENLCVGDKYNFIVLDSNPETKIISLGIEKKLESINSINKKLIK